MAFTLLCKVALVNQSGNHMRIFQIVIVKGPEDICWDDADEVITVLQVVGSR